MDASTPDEPVLLNPLQQLRGRGALINPTGRFEPIEVVFDPEFNERRLSEDEELRTTYYRDSSKSVVSFNDSPDVGFNASVNPYRGCEHGCIYCYARPTHEYFGLSAGLDFESKIFVKTDAPELLRKALSAKSWEPQVLAMSGVTDCYQPAERHFKLTRQCLEVLLEFRNPVGIITKNYLVTRDIDVLSELAKFNAAKVYVSLTTLDEELARTMEPRTASPAMRLRAIRELSGAGIPVGINMGPLVPGLTDHEIDRVLEAAKAAGAGSAGYTMLRLPYGVKDLFETWLETHYPNKKRKVLNRIRDVRGGQLYKSQFGSRMRGEGKYSEYIDRMFALARKRHGLDQPRPRLTTAHFRVPGSVEQMRLF